MMSRKGSQFCNYLNDKVSYLFDNLMDYEYRSVYVITNPYTALIYIINYLKYYDICKTRKFLVHE